jgi:hypothetical protein
MHAGKTRAGATRLVVTYIQSQINLSPVSSEPAREPESNQQHPCTLQTILDSECPGAELNQAAHPLGIAVSE